VSGDGLCECGCGGAAPISSYTSKPRGYVEGQPRRFIRGHHARLAWNTGPRKTHYVEKDCGHDTPCWVWQLYLTPKGYGRVQKNGRSQWAHRWYYEQHRGPIPDGLTLDHLCRNPACVNPYHLEPVTNAENQRRGTNAKLTEDDVRRIRRAMNEGITGRSLAKRYGVSESLMSAIRTRKLWADVAEGVA